MRYTYRTIQAPPHATLLLSFGVGVIVVNEETQDYRVRTIKRAEDICVLTDLNGVIVEGLEGLQEQFRAVGRREEASGSSSFGADSPTTLANVLVEPWNNYLTIDPPKHVDAVNLDEAVDFLFEVYVPAGPSFCHIPLQD